MNYKYYLFPSNRLSGSCLTIVNQYNTCPVIQISHYKTFNVYIDTIRPWPRSFKQFSV